MNEILGWKPTQSVAGEPLLVSFYFSPQLCMLLKIKNTKIIKCKIVNSGLYDGEYMCVIDKFEFQDARGPDMLLVGTVPIQWNGNPGRVGNVLL